MCRWGRVISAVVSEESAVGSSFSATDPDAFKLTYLEVGYRFFPQCIIHLITFEFYLTWKKFFFKNNILQSIVIFFLLREIVGCGTWVG